MSQADGTTPFTRRSLLKASAVGTSALAVPSLLGACSSSGSDSGSGSDNTNGKAPLELPADATDGPTYPSPYVGPRARDLKPFGDGSTTFKIVVPTDATVVGSWANNKATAYFEKLTGVKIQFQEVLTTASDGSTDLTKVNAILSSGDLPDAFMGIPLTQAQVSLYGQQGAFTAVDDLIKVYAPAARKMFEEVPGLRALNASSDNKLYQMPGVNDCYHCRSSQGRAWINKEYMDKVGGQMPTTTEELRQLLLEFQGKNPSGKSGFLPFTAGQGNPLDNYFMQSFLYSPPGSNTGGWLRLNQGKVELTARLDEWREALKYLNQLNKDGLLTAQAFSMTGAELQQAGNTGRVGFSRSYWWGSFFNPVPLDANALWRDYVAVPPVKGPSGVNYSQWDYYSYSTGPGGGLVITSKCTKPEVLVQWADYMYDLRSIMWAYDGIYESNWWWGDKDQKGINGKGALFRDKQWPAPAGMSWNQYAPMYRSIDFRGGQQVDPKAPTFEAGLWAAGEAYKPFAEPQDMQLPPLIIPDDSAATQADIATSVYQAVSVGLSNFSLGKKDPNNDADWQAYVAQFDAMKVQDYLDIYQKAYDTRPK
ncbi:putative aldouronate transport system substrate-binding protein [Friedmanniella endophytica]|uniref:Putative aldouronate transport system substrate-binding protein n=1 Tax=Microlunatus kandeliicorticis TaxID=1759536 RepID=A0A7W3P720_9ACTN|nr:hypothetical protein [Microlunatus kandeliicorticis]MBA8795646.1 putative aldouronate transport system substrate-binding protein [Microlunatus kandeliicorticis]